MEQITQKKTQPWHFASLALVLCTLVRLLPLRAPNVEPVFATMMPFSRRYGPIIGFVFCALNIVVYDALTAGIGSWTFVVALAYGIIGAFASYVLPKFKKKIVGYVSYAIVGTVVFDLATGLTMGPIFFHQPFIAAVVGQIPFTLLHLVGNVAFALTLSPAVDFALTRLSSPAFVLSLEPRT